MSARSWVRGVVMRVALALGVVQARAAIASLPASSSVSTTAPSRKRKRRKRTSPQTVSVTRWMQRDVESAQHMAAGGDLTIAGQLYRALSRDGLILGLLGTRTGGLVRLPKRFTGDPMAVAYLEGAEGRPGRFEAIFPDAEVALLDADGIVIGAGVGELLEVEGCEHLVFCRLDPEFLRYHWWEDCWYYQSVNGLERITPGDGRWILHTPGGRQEPWNRGLWAALARAYISKEHAFFYRENWNSKLAHPARVAFAPAAATDEQSQSWFQKVLAWGINTVFGLKPGYDVKLLESNGRGYESFKETIVDANQEFMVAIAGQVVTVTGGAGFANADIHATIRSDLIQGDGKAVAATLNAQALPHVLRGRVPRGAAVAVEWDTRPPANRKQEAESLSAAAKAITELVEACTKHGIEVDVRELASRFAVPVAPPVPTEPIDQAPAVELDPAGDGLGPTAAELAAKMTEYGIERCEHGKSNRCWLCGIERVRDFDVDEVGETVWRVAWRPIESHLTLVEAA